MGSFTSPGQLKPILRFQEAKGTYVFLGIRNERTGYVYPNYISKFCIDESVSKLGGLGFSDANSSFYEQKVA